MDTLSVLPFESIGLITGNKAFLKFKGFRLIRLLRLLKLLKFLQGNAMRRWQNEISIDFGLLSLGKMVVIILTSKRRLRESWLLTDRCAVVAICSGALGVLRLPARARRCAEPLPLHVRRQLNLSFVVKKLPQQRRAVDGRVRRHHTVPRSFLLGDHDADDAR